jgi:FliI/YscN family ATPase
MSRLRDLIPEVNDAAAPLQITGSVVAVRGPLVIARMPSARIGDLCLIAITRNRMIPLQVVSFSDDLVNLSPFDSLQGLAPGAPVYTTLRGLTISVPVNPTGLVLDALGKPLAEGPRSSTAEGTPLSPALELNLHAPAPQALSRRLIDSQLLTGVRLIDLCTPIGYGQRLGLVAPAGVGKSTLLGMIARGASAEVNVIALIGERGREVSEFLHEVLGEEGRRKSIVVVSTSDESAARRWAAALTATAIAEHLRDQGKRVLLLVDSLTRAARAIRDMTLAAGEIPVRQGYTPSVYAELPRLLERSGNNHRGSITAIYTLLSAGEGEPDALAEEVKSILDGHLVLNPALIHQGLRPAIDPLASLSRLGSKLVSEEHQTIMAKVLQIVARVRRDRDLVLLGGQADPNLAACLELEPIIIALLSQPVHCRDDDSASILRELSELVKRLPAH